MKKILFLLTSFFALAVPSFAQTALTVTTLAATLTSPSQTNLQVTSATGIVAPSFVGNPTQTGGNASMLIVDNEAMFVRAVQGTLITVQRGANGTAATGHTTGAAVVVASPSQLLSSDPAGYCVAANTTSPTAVINTAFNSGAHYWNCIGTTWQSVFTSGAITPAATAAAIGTTGQTFTVKGLAQGEPISLVSFPTQTSLCPATGAAVTAANTVTLYFTTLTAAACTPAAGTYNFSAPRFTP